MALYKERFFSLVKFCNDCSSQIGTQLGIPAPIFINWDAHAQVGSVPNAHSIGLVGYSLHLIAKMPEVFVGFVVSTYNDENLVLHHEIADFMMHKLEPEKRIPVYTETNTTTQTGFMVITDGVIVEPIQKDVSRTLQLLNVRLLSDGVATSR